MARDGLFAEADVQHITAHLVLGVVCATLLQWTTLWWEIYGRRNTKILREKAVIYVGCGQ